jgi:hypothetical protein
LQERLAKLAMVELSYNVEQNEIRQMIVMHITPPTRWQCAGG